MALNLVMKRDIFEKMITKLFPDQKIEVVSYEILSKKMAANAAESAALELEKQSSKPNGRQEKSTFQEVLSSPIAKQIGREIVRGVFGMLFGKKR